MIEVKLTVDNATELLVGYGAGGLIRLERSATIAGVYAEITTIALVAGTDEYLYWDGTGTSTSWYKTRLTKADGTGGSAYSDPFQVAAPDSYLTVAQLRQHVTSSLVDAALQRLLDAARAAITVRFGEVGNRTEELVGGDVYLALNRPLGAIVSVTETVGATVTILAVNDYNVHAGQFLERTSIGTNPADEWLGEVAVVYVPLDDLAERIRLQLALVKLDLAYSGYESQTIGDYSERMGQGTYRQQREDIFASYGSGGALVFA